MEDDEPRTLDSLYDLINEQVIPWLEQINGNVARNTARSHENERRHDEVTSEIDSLVGRMQATEQWQVEHVRHAEERSMLVEAVSTQLSEMADVLSDIRELVGQHDARLNPWRPAWDGIKAIFKARSRIGKSLILAGGAVAGFIIVVNAVHSTFDIIRVWFQAL